MPKATIQLGDDVRELDFVLFDVVYLDVQREPIPGKITGYMVDDASVLYRVGWGSGGESVHYGPELRHMHPGEYE